MVAINETQNQLRENKDRQEMTEVSKQRADLDAYLKEIGQPPSPELLRKFEEFDKHNQLEPFRRADVDEKGNLADYLTRHKLLAGAYLRQKQDSQGLIFTVDFLGNRTAEAGIGAGDMLPPNVLAIAVQRPDGSFESKYAVRRTDRGRIGYYDVKTGKYVPVYPKWKIYTKNTESLPLDKDGKPLWNKKITIEHDQIYRRGAGFNLADIERENFEKLKQERAQKENTIPEIKTAHQIIAQKTAGKIDDFRKEYNLPPISTIPRPPAPGPELSKQPKVGPDGRMNTEALLDFYGNTPEKVGEHICKIDPFTGKPITFLGREILDGVQEKVVPILKQIEADAIREGVTDTIHIATCTFWREVVGSTTGKLSNHSFGVAIDLNPDQNPLGKDWKDLNPQKRLSEKLINIFKKYGWDWGGDWKGRKDPMHMQYLKNPYESVSLITDPNAKKYADYYLKKTGTTTTVTAEAPHSVQTSLAISERPKELIKSEKPAPSNIPEVSKKELPASGPKILEANKEKYFAVFGKYEEKYNLPQGLLMRIFIKETGALENAPRAASKVGAGGLLQLMPKVAKEIGMKLGYDVQIYPTIEIGQYKNGQKMYELDPRDSRNNIEMVVDISAWLVNHLWKKFGDVTNVMRAYNWGEGNLKKWLETGTGLNGKPMPEETVKYTQ